MSRSHGHACPICGLLGPGPILAKDHCMESRIKVFGHPLHQLVVPFPIGALGLSVLMDACYSFTGNKDHLTTARQALDFGLATAVVAMPIGAADLAAIKPGTRA